MLLQKLIEQLQGFIPRGATEQILRIDPQVRIKFVAPVLTAVTGVPHIEQAKQSVPNVVGIGSVYSLNRNWNVGRLISSEVGLPCVRHSWLWMTG